MTTKNLRTFTDTTFDKVVPFGDLHRLNPTRSIRHPWRILTAIDPPAFHQARPSEGQSLQIGLTAMWSPTDVLGKSKVLHGAMGKFGADTE